MLERVQNKLGLRLCFRMHFILFYATKRYFVLLYATKIHFMLLYGNLMHLLHLCHLILPDILVELEVFTPSKAKNLLVNRHREAICRF